MVSCHIDSLLHAWRAINALELHAMKVICSKGSSACCVVASLAHSKWIYAHAVAFYAASNIISGAWDTTSFPRLPNLRPPNLRPVSWSLPSLAWPWRPREDGYTDLPMVETDLYSSAESGHSPRSEPPLVTYVPPHNPPPLQDPQTFPVG